MSATKKAMVTGASSGIGLAFAERLAKEGYAVTLVARSQKKLEELAARLGEGHRTLVADLSALEDIRRVAADVAAGGYDLLVNNAGVAVYGRFHESDLESQLAMTRLNNEALLTLAHAYLKNAKSGDALMNVSSSLAFSAFPGAAVYCATKYFVTGLSESLWFENRERGVYVCGLHPGVTKTNFHEAAGGTDKNRPPEGVAQTPEAVVDAAMAALRSRSSPTVISGFMNKAMIFTQTRLMPRKAVVKMMGGFAPA